METEVRRDRVEILVAGALGIILAVGLSFWSIRSIVGQLAGLAHTIDTGADSAEIASNQAAAASQTLAEGATEQAASLEETSAISPPISLDTGQ